MLNKGYCITIIIILFSFVGCSNTRPLYSKNSSVYKEMCKITVEPIQSIDYADFYDYLTELIPNNRNIQPEYSLKIEFVNHTTPLIIEKNSDILRSEVNSLIKYTLRNQQNHILQQESFRLSSSYNTIHGGFSGHIADEQIKKNLSKLAAEEILENLYLYFSRKKSDMVNQ